MLELSLLEFSLFVAGAVFGEVGLSLFVAGAVLGEVALCTMIFVAGAVFREVALSLFVAGAVFGEIWNDCRSAKYLTCIFQCKMRVTSAKRNLSCRAGCGLTGSCSDHGLIIPGSVSQCKRRFSRFLSYLECHFSGRRSIYSNLVVLEGNSCCSAQ